MSDYVLPINFFKMNKPFSINLKYLKLLHFKDFLLKKISMRNMN